jgi:exportin-1
MSLLQDIIFVLTDSFHKHGFKQQATILAVLFQVIATSYITVPIDKDQGNLSNQQYVYNTLVNIFSTNFATLSKHQTSQYIERLFETCGNFQDFKVHIYRYYQQHIIGYTQRLFDQDDTV